MKLSYQWLRELVNGLRLSPTDLAEILNLKVAAVEKVEKLGKGLDKVVVAEILEIKKHPKADKLQLVKVKTIIHNSPFIIQIVCGAFNIKVGDKVPLALSGAKLTNGMEIKESIIRGVKSDGMLCAEDELGVGEDHTGILILDKSAKEGEKVSKVLGLDDTIIDIENSALTHRPDLFAHLGFAREIAAITGNPPSLKLRRTLDFVAKSKIWTKSAKIENYKLKIKIENYKDCPRYIAVVIDNIKIGPSPMWLQNRLRSLGIRPISNVVDITNYVMMEVGQPLHAFDFDKLAEQRGIERGTTRKIQRQSASSLRQSAIVVRRAKTGEKLLALDGIERKLDSDVLVIAGAKKPIALAGIMGGEESGITEKTKTIVIESANFNSVVIRKGARKLGLRTEANLRFEKGLPLIFAEQGILRAIELIEKIAGGKVVSKIYDVKDKKTEKLLKTPKKISLEIQKVSDLIGEKIYEKQIIKYLTSLGFGVKGAGKKLLMGVPLHRADIEFEEDIIEEVARVYGYEKITPQPIQAKLEVVPEEPLLKLEKNLKNILVGLGFDEVYNYSFANIHESEHKSHESIREISDQISADSRALEIVNPMSPEQKYLRISLLPGLIKNAEKNLSYFNKFRIFEAGKIYREKEDLSSVALAKEEKYLSGLILEKNEKMFYLVKGVIEVILEKVRVDKNRISYKLGQNINYQYIDNLTGVLIKEKLIGVFGELNETIKNNLKIPADLGVFEINLETLRDLKIGPKIFEKISSYPPILRDLAFIVSKNVIFDDLLQTIENFHPLIYTVESFDVFESEKLGKDVRNIAFHLIFQSFKKTLKSEEIDKIINDLVKILEQKFNAKLRTF